jgi:hypothetical protein
MFSIVTDGYIHFITCTDIVELGTYTDISFWLRLQLFDLPGWLACRPVWDWVLPGVTPIQVQSTGVNLFLGSTYLYEPCLYRMAYSCTLALSKPIMKAVQTS